jgi:rubredoxin
MEKEMVICKVCGYVMEKDQLHDVCPACGVSSKSFEAYKSKVSPQRESILSLHIHPIILHFPQAAAIFGLLLTILLLIIPESWKSYALICAKFNIFLLPLCVLGGYLSGLLDGQIRFKSLKRKVLIQKMFLGCLFFILSLVAALLLLLVPFSTGLNIILIVILMAAAGVAMVLGKIGSKLFTAVYPGK